MRPSLLASLLILSIFLTEAQGARLAKGFISDHNHHKIHEDQEGSLIKTSNGGVEEDHEVVHCKDGHCSGSSGKYRPRKLMTRTPCTTTSSKNNVKKGGRPRAVSRHYRHSWDGLFTSKEKHSNTQLNNNSLKKSFRIIKERNRSFWRTLMQKCCNVFRV